MRAISAGPRDQIEAAWVGDVRIRTHDARRLGRRHRSRLEFDVEYAIRRLHASSFLRLSRARHARRVGGSTAGNTRLEMTHKMRRAAGNTHVAAPGSFTRTRCAARTTPAYVPPIAEVARWREAVERFGPAFDLDHEDDRRDVERRPNGGK